MSVLVADRMRVVPAEFVGLARLFRDRIEAPDEDTSKRIDDIAMPLALRRRRHPMPRRDALIDTARRWRTELAGVCRLALAGAKLQKG
jgi:hypothetical protein